MDIANVFKISDYVIVEFRIALQLYMGLDALQGAGLDDDAQARCFLVLY